MGGTAKFSRHIKQPCKQRWPRRGCCSVGSLGFFFFYTTNKIFTHLKKSKEGQQTPDRLWQTIS